MGAPERASTGPTRGAPRRAGSTAVAAALLACAAALLAGSLPASLAGAASPGRGGDVAYVGDTCERIESEWLDYVSCRGELYKVGRGGSAAPVKLAEGEDLRPIDAAWSPDGKSLAVTGTGKINDPATGSPSPASYAQNVFRVSADGARVEPLTDNTRAEGQASVSYEGVEWFPGGGRIVYAKMVDEGEGPQEQYDLYALNVATGAEVQLTRTPYHEMAPSVSPDGRRIAYASLGGGSWDVWALRLARGGTPARSVKLTDGEAYTDGLWNVSHFDPDWSPDGEQIAFSSDRSGRSDIYRMKARPEGPTPDGGYNRPVRLTSGGGAGEPAWSPGGKRIAYSAGSPGAADIFTMRADDGSRPVRLTDNPDDDRSPSWQPLP